MKKELLLLNLITLGLLAGCGGSGGSGSDSGNGASNEQSSIECVAKTQTVQWQALLTENAAKLSDYQLFSSQCNPTTAPSERGLAYDLSVPLFTDYASKYRFIFIPEGEKATYVSGADTTIENTDTGRVETNYIDDGTLDFPVGTVIVKTFSLPTNTNDRGFDNEELIETRLLIHREGGWIGLPYVWNADKTDALFDDNGELYRNTKLTHKGEQYTFTYGVPDFQKCSVCHSSGNEILPIGPKVRYLNMDYNYGDAVENQLERWVAKGLLDDTNLPVRSERESVSIFNDDIDLDNIQPEVLEGYAKSWLDINCAHCHSSGGKASNTNMFVEYTRPFTDRSGHGVCSDPVSGAGAGYQYIIEPGNPARSLLIYRMSTQDSGDRMPPLGRDLIHNEGLALVTKWIESVDGSCN